MRQSKEANRSLNNIVGVLVTQKPAKLLRLKNFLDQLLAKAGFGHAQTLPHLAKSVSAYESRTTYLLNDV